MLTCRTRRCSRRTASAQAGGILRISTLEERRHVTILFADVVASSQLSARDAELFREQMARYFGIAREEIERYGGTVEKFIGDAVMAVFGLPSLHEDDPLRAVRAAWAIQARMRPEVDAGTLPQIRIGITSGEVIADPASAARGEFLVTGDAVNLAARLQQSALPGQILVGESTVKGTRRAVDYRALPPVEIKGWTKPVDLYECTGIRTHAPLDRLTRGISSPLIGRDTELAVFAGCLERLQGGQGGVVLVTGEAGLGKSRLVSEARDRFVDVDCRWLEGRTLSFGRSISYWPFLEIIRSASQITEDDSELDSWRKLEQHLRTIVADEISDVLPYLATVLALPVRGVYEQRVKYLDGDAMGGQIFRSSRRYFEDLARQRPLVLVIEDMHWIDESSGALLEHLLPVTGSVPMLVVGVSRLEPETAATRLHEAIRHDRSGRYREISLTPLTPDLSILLSQNLLEISHLPVQIRDLIVQRAEGNPFFIEEIVRSLIDVRAVMRDEGSEHWVVTPQLDRIMIPDTLRGVIMARIDRLDDAVKQVLKTAAVIGRSFLYRVLAALAETGERLDRDLEELLRLELIREKRHLPDLEYIFKHALTQEAAYESILLRRRRELHRQVGQTIEALFADRLEEFFSLLSYHYARAEDWEKAQEYLFKAGDQASQLAADAEALAHYRQAMSAYERAFGQRWDPLQRATLERKIGEALVRRGEFDRARDYLYRALAFLGTPLPRSGWSFRWAMIRELVRQVGHRLAPGLFVQPAPAANNARVVEQTRVYSVLGWMDRFTDLKSFALTKILLLNVAESNGLESEIAHGLMSVGVVWNHMPGLAWLAERYHRRSVALADTLRQPVAQAMAYLGRGLHDDYQGRWPEAIDFYRSGCEAAWKAGFLLGWGSGHVASGRLRFLRGEFSACLKEFEDLIKVGQDAGDQQLVAWGLWLRGLYLNAVGPLEQAETYLRQAIKYLEAVPDYISAAVVNGDLGDCLLRQDRVDDARELLIATSQQISRRGLTGLGTSRALNALAEAFLVEASRTESRHRAEWLRKAKHALAAAHKEANVVNEGRPSEFRLRGTHDWLKGRVSSALRWWDRSLASAANLGARYEAGLTHLEIGRRGSDAQHLERAEAIFSEIGATFDLMRVRRLLETPRDEGSALIRT